MPQTQQSHDRRPHRAVEEQRQNREGLFAALLLAFFLHLLLYWITPGEVFERPDETVLIPQTLMVELEPLPEEPVNEETYVRAAPDVPDEVPEDTSNVSDRNQRAAQEEMVPLDAENTPFVEGDEAESNRLVQGDPFQEPVPPAPPAASTSSGGSPMVQQEAAPQAQPAERNPDFLELVPESDEGLASIEVPDQARDMPEELAEAFPEMPVTSRLDGQGEAQMTTPPQAQALDTPTPRPRPRVERDTSLGPIKDNRQGVIRIGRLAFDAEYSEFGEYWRRVAEIIETRWRNLVFNTRSIPFGGYRVAVEFKITREGQVTDVKVVHSTAGKLAETISIDAIVGEAPFFEWTPEMIIRMGEAAQCGIHFIY